jgi:hypothetical protein
MIRLLMEIIMAGKYLLRAAQPIAVQFRGLAVALVAGIAVIVASALPRTAHAQAGPAFTPKITVTPAIAPANAPRSIEISGSAITCGASTTVTGQLDSSLVSQTGNLLIRIGGFVVAPPVASPLACDVVVPYRFNFSYTPSSDGAIRIAPVFLGGVVFGGSRIITGPESAEPRSEFDITGAWYDPMLNGSGFTFVHNASRTDRAAGTYYSYDANGVPRWFLISNIKWSNNGRTLQGLLISSQGSGQCAAGLAVCPMPAQPVAGTSNSIQIDFELGPTTLQFPPPPPNWIGKTVIRTPSQETVYSGNIYRIGL